MKEPSTTTFHPTSFWEIIASLDVVCILLTPLLAIIPFLKMYDLLPRVILAGILASVVWWYPLLSQLAKRQKQFINFSNLMATGFTMMFTIPGIYITCYRDEFEAVHEQYTDYYPQSLALIAIAGLFYLLGYILSTKIGNNNQLRKLPHLLINKKRYYSIVGVFLSVQWIIHLWLYKSGTYFHSLRSDYQFEHSALLSILYTFDYIGNLCVYSLLVMTIREKSRMVWLASFLVLLNFVWALGSGAKVGVLMIIISIIIIMSICDKINLKTSAVIVPFLVLTITVIFPLLQMYILVTNATQLDPDAVSVTDVADSFSRSSEVYSEEGRLPPLHKTMQRFGDIRSLGGVYQLVPDEIPYIYGESYLGILFMFVPHAVWPSKPDFEIRGEITRKVFPKHHASYPLTLVGEALVNFSLPGVIYVFFIIGIIGHRFDSFVLPRVAINPWWAALLAEEGYKIIWTSLVLGQLLSDLIRMMVLTFVLSAITTSRQHKPKVLN
jgi:hypothetical protein